MEKRKLLRSNFGGLPGSSWVKNSMMAYAAVARWAMWLLLGLLTLVVLSAQAATALTVAPITWNVVGLDSNNVNVGPNDFPVGARVCNTSGSATTATVNFNWTSANAYINLRPGTLSSLSLPLNAGQCKDTYFEVAVARNTAAYDTTRDYTITATDGSGTASTPIPRQIYVEHLVSQARNSTLSMQLSTDGGSSYTNVQSGGTMNLMVGQTYFIKLIAETATSGYEQSESFINFPNTIFQVLSVSTTYTADSSAYVNSPNDKLYGDACLWDSNPASPNYRSCLSTGKVGGSIVTTYQVKILSVPSAPLINPEPLNALIYDFSGSSYHYNSDFSASVRSADIVSATVAKSFAPKTITPGGTSTLTFTINNPGPQAISNVNFTDSLPSGMTVSGTSVTYTGCGTPSPSSLTNGTTALSFSSITVNALSICTVSLSVTATTAQTYTNTTSTLKIGTDDTGSMGSDSLVVSTKPAAPSTCTTRSTMATWTMPTTGQGSGSPPPSYTTKASDVSAATASAALTGAGSQSIITAGTGGTTNAWNITDAWTTSVTSSGPDVANAPYFQFAIDSSNYGDVQISLIYDLEAQGDWASNNANGFYIHSSSDGSNFPLVFSITNAAKGSWQPAVTGTAATSGISTTWFRITTAGRGTAKSTASVHLDDITITGCPRPNPPTLSKSFSPTSIVQGSTSTLAFNITNPNTGIALSGISFTDVLPAGLSVADGTASACGGTVTTTASTRTISLTGTSLAASGTCSFNVAVTGSTTGNHTNTSGSITATESGPNTTSSGYGVSNLTVVTPPVIAKTFGTATLYTDGIPSSTSLTFSLTNPNTFTSLTGVNFTDSLPTGLQVDNPSGSPISPNCTTGSMTGQTITASNNATSIGLSGATLTAGASCTFSVNVKVSGTTPVGSATNSVTVSSSGPIATTGNTATATINVKTVTPNISILKQVSTDNTNWFNSVNVTPGASVYYRFTVENTGDVALSTAGVSDPKVPTSGCAWSSLPLYETVTCTGGPVTALAGDHPNTATASGTSGSGPASASDSADYFGANAGFSLLKEISTSSTGPWSSAINVTTGATIYYRFILTNIGNTAIDNPAVVDNKLSTSTCFFTNPLPANSSTLCVVPTTASTTPSTTVTNTAHGTGTSGETSVTTPNSSASYTTGGTTVLSIAKSHAGNFTQGQMGAIYTLTVGNTGTLATSGTITVVDTLPIGLTYGSATGTGWTCGASGQTVTCASSSVIAAGGTGNAITLTVNVATNAPASLTNAVTASGGGASNTPTALDPTTTNQAPVLTLSKTHTGSFTQGQTGIYTLTVGNTGSVATSGTITVVDTLPTGLTYASGVGTGWTCGASGQTVTCTSSSIIAAGGTGNAISLTVNVAANAPSTLTNTATASGGGATNTPTATDSTTITPTYALLSDFRAYALGGVPVVEWQTSGEIGTLGFDLYRKDVNQPDESAFVQLNTEMLPALIDAPQGGAYYFVDTGAQIGQTYTYRLIEHEVDAKGEDKERNLGIYTVRVETQTPTDANITLAELVDDYTRKARAPSAEETARRDAAKAAQQEAKVHKRQKKSSDMVKLYVKDQGLYRVDAADLATLLSIDAKEAKKQIGKYGYQLTSQGRDVAYHAADDNSALYFYNPGYKSVYTSTNVFWLGLGKKAGVPMAVVDGVPSTKPNQPKPPVPTGAETFQRTLEFEENHLAALGGGLYGPEDDYWLWNYLYAGQPGLDAKTYALAAPSAVTSNAATLIVELVGGNNTAANPDHHVVAALNGSTVGETRWDGIAKQTLNLTLRPGALQAGDNTLTLTALKDAGVSKSLPYVDRFTLTYTSLYQADSDRLAFSSAQNAAIRLSGFSAASVAVVSLSDPWNPVWVSATGQAVAGGYGVTLNPASANTSYWAAAVSAVPVVENAWTDAPSQLKDVPLDANYLVIAPEEVKSAAQALADYRKTQGFSTAVVDLEDIMDEFNNGLSTPKAIRDFLTLAYTQWKVPPRFVVLAGAGSYDYQNYLGYNDSLIPPLLVQTPFGLAASDNSLGDVVGDDGLPEITIGRIPAVNNTELQAYVDKVKAYEIAGAEGWMQKVSFVTDNADAGGNFPADSDDLAALVPAPYQASRIYLGTSPYQTASLARAGVLNALNQGAAYFNYLGHGSPYRLANEGLLLQGDVAGLISGGRPPVALFLACSAADFSLPGYDSLGEALVLKQSGGAAAVWGSTGLSLNSETKQLADGFFNETFRLGNRVLGEAVAGAYQNYGVNHSRFMLDIYTILGDPALRMK